MKFSFNINFQHEFHFKFVLRFFWGTCKCKFHKKSYALDIKFPCIKFHGNFFSLHSTIQLHVFEAELTLDVVESLLGWGGGDLDRAVLCVLQGGQRPVRHHPLEIQWGEVVKLPPQRVSDHHKDVQVPLAVDRDLLINYYK